MNTIRLTWLFLFLSAMCGCVQHGVETTAHSEDETPAAPTNRIDIPSTVRSNLGITFAPAERRRVDSTIRVPGAFELQPLARHEYRMTLPGHVRLLVDQYQHVAPGDVLYRFQSPQWPELHHEIIVGEQGIDSAFAEIDVAKARIAEAEQRLVVLRDRLATLAGADFKQADLESQAAELDASLPRLRAEHRLAKIALTNARRTREHAVHRAAAAIGVDEQVITREVEFNGTTVPAYRTVDWIDVVAAKPGIVESLAITDGAFVEASSLVVSTVDPSQVRFRAIALQADLARLANHTDARIVPPKTPGIDVDDSVAASVTIGLEAHPEQRTVTLLAVPTDARTWIRPGVSAFLEVVVDSTNGPAIAIPRAAIVRDGIVHVFFRRDPNDANQAIRVEADMGTNDGRWVVINSGLALNDEVVLNGAYELKLATQLSGTSQKGGHFHADGTFHGEH